ncbi:RbsD/FucU family protein [Martelella radicis]|uniref:L-fucose mutarotase n=1 Tax=Martelella radicis TaxID=1397476 RepID=A0A7W6KN32_9HYPH|nr:RbsD/FucU family protein [Martelella radicis]MBB4124333.1 L-fucose mutarotase [Martelella radicis]
MLKTQIIHPQLLSALAKCGHKAKILIADANYSVVTNSSADAEIVYLNFAPGMIPATTVLKGISQFIDIEATTMLAWPDDFENTIHGEYLEILPAETPMTLTSRDAFYAEVRAKDALLVIATGETRRFANLLITVGSVIL